MMDERLLQPGWAGLLTLEEAEFIKEQLLQSRVLRTAWLGIVHENSGISLTQIAIRAYPENPALAYDNMRLEQKKHQCRRAAGTEPRKGLRGSYEKTNLGLKYIELGVFILGKSRDIDSFKNSLAMERKDGGG